MVYMLVWDYSFGSKQSWFEPDRVGNFRHDIPDGANFIVLTALGDPVCGRFCSTEVDTYIIDLHPCWNLVKDEDAQKY